MIVKTDVTSPGPNFCNFKSNVRGIGALPCFYYTILVFYAESD